MGDFLDRRCDKLSTGMKQKTSIARTLVHDPQVMIFDEPTLGLDVMTARSIVRFVRECRSRGKTVIYSTHVMSEAEKLCDVIGIIHGGALRAEGTLAELRADGRGGPRGKLREDRLPGGGTMSWRTIGTVYAKELRDTLSDRRTLISMIVVPTLFMPALILGMGKVASVVVAKAKEEIPRIMVIGGADSPGVLRELRGLGQIQGREGIGRLEGADLGQEGPRGRGDPPGFRRGPEARLRPGRHALRLPG
jgi:hypothetical protein